MIIQGIQITPIEKGTGLYFDRIGTMKILVDHWKLITFKDIENIPRAIASLQARCKHTIANCNELEEISSSIKCSKRTNQIGKSIDKTIEKFESLSHLTSTRRQKRSWFDGIGSVLKTVFGTLDNDDAIYYDSVINKIIKDDKEIYRIMKNQIQVTQSAIQNFNNTIRKLNENERTLDNNFVNMKKFIDDLSSNVTIVNVRSILNQHFSTMSMMTTDLIEEIDTIVNAILFAKQNVLHPAIITPKQIYSELMSNLNFLKQNKEFPLPLNLEDIHLLIDISSLDVFYINYKLIFLLNIPLVTPQEFELYHVFPLPVPHDVHEQTYALVQPSKRYLGITTNKHSYVQFNDVNSCKKLSNIHYICEDVNEYSSMSNPSCESQLMTKVLKNLPLECITKILYGQVEIWQKLTNNRWIYIYSKPTKLTIDCPSQDIKEHELQDTGIITLEKNCKGYANLIQITATGDITTNFTAPIINLDITKDDCCNEIKVNQTKQLLQPVKIGNIQLDDLNLASIKLHSVEEQIKRAEQNIHSIPYNTSHVSYIVYTLCGITLSYLLWRFCKIIKPYKHLTNQHSDNDRCCCIRIFNQCNTRQSTNIEPIIEMNEIRQEENLPTITTPLRSIRSPLTRSSSIESKRKLNMNN